MPGAERLRDSGLLNDLVKQQQAAGGLYAAICATPAVFFESQGILNGARATAHPAFADKLSNQEAVSQRVVVDGNLTTSRGPGTAFEFALALVGQLYGGFVTHLLCFAALVLSRCIGMRSHSSTSTFALLLQRMLFPSCTCEALCATHQCKQGT